MLMLQHGGYELMFSVLMFGLAAYVIMPPARYDHPYKGKLSIRYLAPASFQMACIAWDWHVRACSDLAWPKGEWCKIYIRREASNAERGALYRHERAHCNGWPAHHPRG